MVTGRELRRKNKSRQRIGEKVAGVDISNALELLISFVFPPSLLFSPLSLPLSLPLPFSFPRILLCSPLWLQTWGNSPKPPKCWDYRCVPSHPPLLLLLLLLQYLRVKPRPRTNQANVPPFSYIFSPIYYFWWLQYAAKTLKLFNCYKQNKNPKNSMILGTFS